MDALETAPDNSRRQFFKLAGGIAGAGMVLSACRRTPPSDTYVGSGDAALLNYLYIINQVEAAFYTQAAITTYYGMTQSENDLLLDLRDQEIAHREFLRTYLGSNVSSPITVNFSAVTFADRTNTLTHATIIEDLATAAINGAIQLFSDTSIIPTLAKMATVEARHAAYARDLLTANSFSDSTVTDANGLNNYIAPLAGMTKIEQYIQTHFDVSKLPTY